MYARSELYFEQDGTPRTITQEELADKLLANGIESIVGPNHVELRPLKLQDASHYFKLVDRSRDHLSQDGDITAKKYPDEESVRESIRGPKNPHKLRFGIWHNDTMVGSINLTPEGDVGVIGYWIGERYTKRGHAASALSAMADFAFSGLGYDKLAAETSAQNKASQRTLEKCGFKISEYTTHETEPKFRYLYTMDKPTE